jgi:hypothetical protein
VGQASYPTIAVDYASETVRRYFDANGPYRNVLRAANLPPSFVIIQRINLVRTPGRAVVPRCPEQRR